MLRVINIHCEEALQNCGVNLRSESHALLVASTSSEVQLPRVPVSARGVAAVVAQQSPHALATSLNTD